MSKVIHIEEKNNTVWSQKQEFKKDVISGLAQPLKRLSSKYFYDDHGSELFNKITQIPEYYLTQSEIEILSANKQTLSEIIGNEPFNLIELGPGEGIKTKILIQQLMTDKHTFRYVPIDISMKYLDILTAHLQQQLPNLILAPIHADYFQGVKWQSEHSHRRNLVLFLGSSIGNFDPDETVMFLKNLRSMLHHDDYFLIGLDLKKDIKTLMRAYDDSCGITREFNLNLLHRINRELGGNFDVKKFTHYVTYNVRLGAMESYLISSEKQAVTIEALKQTVQFNKIEPIYTECSHKYEFSYIEKLAKQAGFSIVKNFLDKREYFLNSLWKVEKKRGQGAPISFPTSPDAN